MYSCGLVLEGGGNRAIYTSGVLDAFMDQGITFPYVIGVSAGSCNAVSYIGKCRGRQHDISIQYSGDKRFMSLENMIKNGEFLNGEWLFGELSYDLSPLDQEAYDRANTTLCVVVTNALTGKAEYMYPKDFHKRGCPILRASCALPGATKGVVLGKDRYFDGGVTDSIPPGSRLRGRVPKGSRGAYARSKLSKAAYGSCALDSAYISQISADDPGDTEPV